MPWHVVSQAASCPTSKPYGVVKDSDGKVVGCHMTHAEARAQVAALYASEKAAVLPPSRVLVPVEPPPDTELDDDDIGGLPELPENPTRPQNGADSKKFDPHQLRDPHTGQWIDTGGGSLPDGTLRDFRFPTGDPGSRSPAEMHAEMEAGEWDGQSALDYAKGDQSLFLQEMLGGRYASRSEGLADVYGEGQHPWEAGWKPTTDLADKFRKDEPITVYRAVEPELEGEGILPGAYVTESEGYAALHAESSMGGFYEGETFRPAPSKIVKVTVRPSELVWLGASHEFLYAPPVDSPVWDRPAPKVKRFDPNQPRDPHTGEWIGVPGVDVAQALDTDDAIHRYEEGWSSVANAKLRGTEAHVEIRDPAQRDPALVDGMIKGMDAAIETRGVEIKGPLYRGLDAGHVTPAAREAIESGHGSFTDAGFVSTTGSRGVAENFAGGVHPIEPVILQIEAAQGSKGLPVHVNDNEAEVVLPRGGVFEVVSATTWDLPGTEFVEGRPHRTTIHRRVVTVKWAPPHA